MANTTIYPYGVSGEQPGGAWPQKITDLQETIDLLAPWAFRGSPSPVNPLFRDIFVGPISGTVSATLRVGTGEDNYLYMLSPIVDLGEIGDTFTLTFSAGALRTGTNQYPCLVFYDENYNYSGYYVQNVLPRTVSSIVTSSYKYARLMFRSEYLIDSYIKDKDGAYLFNGGDLSTSAIKSTDYFFDSSLVGSESKPNSRGDYIGWNFTGSDTAATAQQHSIIQPMYKQIGPEATAFSYSISKIVELPKNTTINIEFSCGVVNSDLMIRLLNPTTATASYYVANANPRTVSVNTSTYTHVQLYFLTANYARCYIKDATNNVMLWQGAQSTQ